MNGGSIYVCNRCGARIDLPGTLEETRQEAERRGWKLRRTKTGGHKGPTLCPMCGRRRER